MAKREKGFPGKKAVKRAGSALARTAKKLSSKLHAGRGRKAEEPVVASAAMRSTPKVKTARATSAAAGTSRPTKRKADVGLDVAARTYTPQQTSLKTPFRADGSDRHRDQEFVGDRPDDRWSNEDHFTNKSGDPRIGTHGRAYEPGERRK